MQRVWRVQQQVLRTTAVALSKPALAIYDVTAGLI